MDLPAPPARWRKYVAALPFGVLALLALALAVLDSAIGHRLLAEALFGTESEAGLRLKIGRIEGSLFSELVLSDIALRDPEGTFLKLPEAELAWRPAELLARRVHVTRLVSRRGVLQRVPHLRPTSGKWWPEGDLAFDRISIERLTVAPAVLGLERKVDLAGALRVTHGAALITLDGNLGGADRLKLRFEAEEARDRFALDCDYAAPKGGLLAALTGAVADRRLRIDGKGTWRDWRGALTASEGGVRAVLRGVEAHGEPVPVDVGQAAGGVLPGLPAALVHDVLQGVDALAEHLGPEDGDGVGGQRRPDGVLADGVPERGIGLRPGVAVVEVAALGGGPLEDPDGRVELGERGGAQLVEDDGRQVAGVAHRDEHAERVGGGRLGDGGPGAPGGLLAQLVEVDLGDAREASRGPPVRGLRQVGRAVRQLEHLAAVAGLERLQLEGELGVGLDRVDAHLPLVVRGGELLRQAGDEAGAVEVHPEQGDAALPGALPVLSGYDHEDDAEPVAAVGGRLQGVHGEPLLPGQERGAGVPGEVDGGEPAGRLAVQRPQRRGEQARLDAAEEPLTGWIGDHFEKPLSTA